MTRRPIETTLVTVYVKPELRHFAPVRLGELKLLANRVLHAVEFLPVLPLQKQQAQP
jgi:hypothetical protein